jgi:hypothetical protein
LSGFDSFGDWHDCAQAGIEGGRLQWGSSSLEQLSAKQLLTVQQPPLMYAALIAFGTIFIFEALNLALSREEGPNVELIDNNEDDAGISGNSINIPTNEKVGLSDPSDSL